MDVGGYAERGLPHVQQDHDFFQRGISGALADAVDGQLELAHARLHRGQGIGDAQAQVIVAVRAHRDAVRAVQILDHAAEHGGVLFGHRVADRVGQIDDRRAGANRPADRFAKKIDFGAARVLGGKFDFRAMIARVAHVIGDGFQGLFARQAQLVMQVQIRRREKRVQPGMRRSGESFERRVNVVAPRARQRRHRAAANFAANRAHAFQVSRRSDGEAALDDVHAERFQLPSHADLLRHRHGKSRGLLPVPQRRVKNAYDVHGTLPHASIPHGNGKQIKFIIVVSSIKWNYIRSR